MGFRFRKSFGSGPFRFNLSKSGIGWSIGGKAARFTKKAGGGYRTTASIPGTGVSYSRDHGGKRKKKSPGCFGSFCILFFAAILISLISSCIDGSLFQSQDNPAVVESADSFNSSGENMAQEAEPSTESEEPELTPKEQKAAELAAASIAAMQANQPKEDAGNEDPEDDPQPNDIPEAPAEVPVVEAPSEDPVVEEDPEPQVEIVYITDTGSKYHRGSCRHLKNSKHEISLDAAKAQGYTACGTCY